MNGLKVVSKWGIVLIEGVVCMRRYRQDFLDASRFELVDVGFRNELKQIDLAEFVDVIPI